MTLTVLGYRTPAADWIACSRCGIEVVARGLCYDCSDVEGLPRTIQFEPAPPVREISRIRHKRIDSRGRISYSYTLPSTGRTTGGQLTAAQVEEIFARIDAGESTIQVAYMLKVSMRCIDRWRGRRKALAVAA